MTALFETEIRQVGTSLGVLIPGKIIRQKHWKKGKKVTVAILEKDLRAIEKGFGMAKGAKPFEREKEDRF